MKSDDGQQVEFFTTSCATRTGVDDVRAKACDQLLNMRVEQKVKQGKADNVRGRIHVTSVTPPASRPPCIPASVQRQREGAGDVSMGGDSEGKKEKLEKDKMEELGGAGVYSVDLWRRALLEDDTWKYDIIPEIMDGHNVIDFVDPDIEKRLEELEKEEELLLAEDSLRDDKQVLAKWKDTQDTLDELHSRMRQRRLVNKLNKTRNHAVITKKTKSRKKGSEVEQELNEKGLPGAKVRGRSSSVRKNSLLGKRKRDASVGSVGAESAAEVAARARSTSIMKGMPSMEVAQVAEKKRRKLTKNRYKLGHKGEGDHWVPDLKPKHLYSGKRGIGKTDRR
jgi:nucleolar GTP-binding protein